jgi:hypothetical protein
MNQKTLLMAIAAVIAVVVIGLWLSGAGQTGSLSGCINCQSTNLTLSVDIYTSNSNASTPGRSLTLKGTLTSADNPVPDRTITIFLENGDRDTNIKNVVTQADGSFSTIYGEEGGSHEYYAVFYGDNLKYTSSRSNIVSSPPWT